MRDFDLDTWFEIAKKGTSGDMVEDILYSWKARATEAKGLTESKIICDYCIHNAKASGPSCPKADSLNTGDIMDCFEGRKLAEPKGEG